ncbi:MAG: hypothetical protein VB047_12135 [Anaerotignum propionicum]|nr:hypothetical protein [Anaerotignum propionicum]MEA5058288.1 hypothetical protein [Anaerotignum propionicum]
MAAGQAFNENAYCGFRILTEIEDLTALIKIYNGRELLEINVNQKG